MSQLHPDAWGAVMLQCSCARDAVNLRRVCRRARLGFKRRAFEIARRCVRIFALSSLTTYSVELPSLCPGAFTHFCVSVGRDGSATVATMHRGLPADTSVMFAPGFTAEEARVSYIGTRVGGPCDGPGRAAFCARMDATLRFLCRAGALPRSGLERLFDLFAAAASAEPQVGATVRGGVPVWEVSG